MTEEEKIFIKAYRNDDVEELLLHASRYPEVDMKLVVEQIRGWQIASKKLPLWAATEGLLYPVHLSLEQCSSQLTAAYKADLLCEQQRDGHPFAITDLTGGFGVDAVMMSKKVRKASLTYVERNAELCYLAQHNFPLLGVPDFQVIKDDCEHVLDQLFPQDAIFIDPARRDSHGRKTYAIEDCTPDVCRLQQRLLDLAPFVMIKLSPMLDINDAIAKLQKLYELHVVSVDGECKELLALMSDSRRFNRKLEEVELGADCGPLICCVNISEKEKKMERFCFTKKEEAEAECMFADKPLSFLFEPNASVLKAGAFKAVASRYQLKKLHPNSHLYTSRAFVEEFPGRKFKVMGLFSFQKQELKRLISSVKKANITVRNFPMSVADLRKRLKISEGGNDFLFATTLNNHSKALILCEKITDKSYPS